MALLGRPGNGATRENNRHVFNKAVDEAIESMQLWPFVALGQSSVDAIVFFVFENECRHLFYGWGNSVGIHCFPPFDRFPYTDETGNHRQNSLSSIRPLPGYEWQDEWKSWIDPSANNTDDNGYEYATVWLNLQGSGSTSSYDRESPFTNVRRRCMRRVMSKLLGPDVDSKGSQASTFHPYTLKVQIDRAFVFKGIPLAAFATGCHAYVQVVCGELEMGRTAILPVRNKEAVFMAEFRKNFHWIDDNIPITINLYLSHAGAVRNRIIAIGTKTLSKEHVWVQKNKCLESNIVLDDLQGSGTVDIRIELSFKELFCVEPIMMEMTAAQNQLANNSKHRSATYNHVNCKGDLANRHKLTARILNDSGVSPAIRSSLVTASASEFLLPSDVYDVLRDLRNMHLHAQQQMQQQVSRQCSIDCAFNDSFFSLAKINYPKGHMKYSSLILFHTVSGMSNDMTNSRLTEAYKESVVSQIYDVSNYNEKILKSRQLIYPNDSLFIKTPKPSQFHMLIKTDNGASFALEFNSFASYIQAAQTLLLLSIGKDDEEFSCAVLVTSFDPNNNEENPEQQESPAKPVRGIKRASRIGNEARSIRDKVLSTQDPPKWHARQLTINTERDLTLSLDTEPLPLSSIVYVELMNCHMLPLSHVLYMSDLTLSVPFNRRVQSSDGDAFRITSVALSTVTGERKAFTGNFKRKGDEGMTTSSTGLTSFAIPPAYQAEFVVGDGQANMFIPGSVAQELTLRQMTELDTTVMRVTATLEFQVPADGGLPAPASKPTPKGSIKPPKPAGSGAKKIVQRVYEANLQLPTHENPLNGERTLSIDDEQTVFTTLRPRPVQNAIQLNIQRVTNIIGVDANGKSDVYYRLYLVNAQGVVTNTASAGEVKVASKLANFVNVAARNNAQRRSSATASPGEIYRSHVCVANVNPFWPEEGDIIITEDDHGLSGALDILVEFWDANNLNADVCLGELRIPIINISNADAVAVRSSEIAPSAKMPKHILDRKYFGTVSYTCSRHILPASDRPASVQQSNEDVHLLDHVDICFRSCLEPTSTHLFRWTGLLVTPDTLAIPPSMTVHINFDGIVMSFPVRPANNETPTNRRSKFELLGSLREGINRNTEAEYREVVVPWEQINMARTVPLCASTLVVEVTLHREFGVDNISEASPFSGSSPDSSKKSSTKPPGRLSSPSIMKEFTATIVIGPCPAFQLMELLENRQASNEVRSQLVNCDGDNIPQLEDVAKILLSHIQQISSDIYVSSMSSAASLKKNSTKHSTVQDELAKLLSRNTENMSDHVSAHCNCWELYTPASRSRRTLRILSLQRLRFRGYFSLLMENLTRTRTRLFSNNSTSRRPQSLGGAAIDLSMPISIEKHVTNRFRSLLQEGKKLDETLDDMIFALEKDVVDVIITSMSAPVVSTGPKLPANGESPLSLFARQLSTLIHSYFLKITSYFSVVTELGKFDMQSDPMSKHALLQALISKDDWIELLIGPYLNTIELKFSRRPLLSYIIDFDALVSLFSTLLNAEIKEWDKNTIESFTKSRVQVVDGVVTANPQSTSSPPSPPSPPAHSPNTPQSGAQDTAAVSVVPWEVEMVHSQHRNKLISAIPENVRFQLQIQIGSKHVEPSSSMSVRNIARIGTINKEVAVAVVNSYRRLGEGYENALDTVTKHMQKLQFERLRRHYGHERRQSSHPSVDVGAAAAGHGGILNLGAPSPPARPSLALCTAASFRNSEVQRGSVSGVTPPPPGDNIVTKEEENCLDFVLSVVNDCSRIMHTHLPTCENEINGYAGSGLTASSMGGAATRETSALIDSDSRDRPDGFQDVDNLFHAISERALGALANVVFFDLSHYFLSRFNSLWEIHIYAHVYAGSDPHTQNGVSANPNILDPLLVVLDAIKDFSENIGMLLEPQQHAELLNRCFRRLCLRYMLFVRDCAMRGANNGERSQHSHHLLESVTAAAVGHIQNRIKLAVNVGVNVGGQIGQHAQHLGQKLLNLTSDIVIQSSEVDDSTSPNNNTSSATAGAGRGSLVNNTTRDSISSTLTHPYEALTFSDEERKQFVVDYNHIRQYFLSMLETEFGAHKDDRHIAVGLNQLNETVKSLFDSNIDRTEFIAKLEETISAVWGTQPPAHTNDESYDLAMCRYLGISSMSSMEDAGKKKTAKFKLQVSEIAIHNSREARWKQYIRLRIDDIIKCTKIVFVDDEIQWDDVLVFELESVEGKMLHVEIVEKLPFRMLHDHPRAELHRSLTELIRQGQAQYYEMSHTEQRFKPFYKKQQRQGHRQSIDDSRALSGENYGRNLDELAEGRGSFSVAAGGRGAGTSGIKVDAAGPQVRLRVKVMDSR